MNMAVIDASGQVLGRFSSVVAKRLLEGEDIIVVNAEKALVTGSREHIFEEFEWRRDVGSQRKGPYYPRTPDRILKRAVRGMLPHKRPRGMAALRKLKVFIALPEEYADKRLEKIAEASRVTSESFVTLEEIAKHLGAKF